PIFLNDNEDHPVQNKESPENSSEENVVSKTNQELPQDLDIHQLIEECSVEVPEEQKQKMEVTLEDKRECDELVCKNPSTIDVCDNPSEILFDSNNDDLSSDDESFEDIEYVDASVLDPAIASVEENVDHQEQEEINLEEI
nr:hypothetical protein [Tanacetum cinerariifolium]